MAQNSPCDNAAMLSTLKEQYGRVLYTYTTHLKEARLLATQNSWFKWADIVLSAITTGGLLGVIFSDASLYEIVSCFSSVALLAISLYTKEARLAEKSVEHKEYANRLWLVRERYLALMTDAPTLTYGEIAQRRDELQQELANLYQREPLTSKRSYQEAQNALKNEEEQFFTKQELNKILPLHLRD